MKRASKWAAIGQLEIYVGFNFERAYERNVDGISRNIQFRETWEKLKINKNISQCWSSQPQVGQFFLLRLNICRWLMCTRSRMIQRFTVDFDRLAFFCLFSFSNVWVARPHRLNWFNLMAVHAVSAPRTMTQPFEFEILWFRFSLSLEFSRL